MPRAAAWSFRSLVGVGLLILVFQPWFPDPAHADDAAVLPKGRFSGSFENLWYFSTQERWNPKGDPEKVADVFNNRRLDSTVFTALAGLNPFVPGGNAIIGTSFVSFRYDFNILDNTIAYGVTDKLTVGVDIPYYYAENKVKAFVNPAGANVGIATAPGAGICALAVVPLALCPANSRPATTEDIQQLLGPGLRSPTPGGPGVQGFGFKRVENFSEDGPGDVTTLAKYQYLRTEDFRLAASAGVRFPTGRQDDPDMLNDVAWSSGAYALLLRLHQDYFLSHLWQDRPAGEKVSQGVPQTGDLFVNFTFRFDWVLPDEATLRFSEPSNPITTNRARAHRDLGDRFELEWTTKYFPFQGFSLSGLYKFGFKLEDQIRVAGRRIRTQLVERATESVEHVYIVRVGYSTVPLFMQKRFPIPMNISMSYRDRFAGAGPSNAASPSQFLKTRYYSLALDFFF